MSTIRENLKEILVFSHIEDNNLYFQKTLMSKHEWDNNIKKEQFAVLRNDNVKENALEIINQKLKELGEELEKINEVYLSLTPIQRYFIKKRKIKLLNATKDGYKRIKKFIARKSLLEKKINRLESITMDSKIVIINEDDFNDDYIVFNRGKEVNKNEDLGKYFVSKVVNSDNEYKIFFLIEEKDVIPKKVIDVKDNKVFIVFAINKHSGSEEYTDLIDINKIMPDGSVMGTKFVAFKEKSDLIEFLGKVNKGLNESYFSAIKSLK